MAALVALVLSTLSPAAAREVTYPADTSYFPNPERGMAPAYEAPWPPTLDWGFCGEPGNFEKYSWTAWTEPLTPAKLRPHRQQGMSVVMMRYHIAEFRARPLSQAFLDRLHADFAAAREVGFKINARFAYNYPMGGPDAPLERVLGHLDQLAPVFRANVDVLAFLDLGFIGCWGEMHTSSNLLVPATRNLNAATRTILDKALAVLPKERMLAVRYPAFKFEYFGNRKDHMPIAPLPSAAAYGGSDQARWGHHDDCPVCGEWNAGTYWSFRNNAEEVKAFLSQDNLYLVQSGEPGDPGTGSPGTDDDKDGFTLGNHESCERIVPLFGRMRWSVLNASYNLGSPKAYNRWKKDGCFETIQKKLGYRFRMLKATLPDSVRAGDTLSISLSMANEGWARPYNPRVVELVLRHAQTGALHRVPVGEREVRLWLPGPGESKTMTFGGLVPANLSAGSYALFLHLPDPTEKLYGRPEFSIRLANQGVWEAAGGFNSLLHTVRVAGRPASVREQAEPSRGKKRAGSRQVMPGLFPAKAADADAVRDARGRVR